MYKNMICFVILVAVLSGLANGLVTCGKVSNPPANATCEVRGQLDPNYLRPAYIDTASNSTEDCALVLLQYSYVDGFLYDSSQKVCSPQIIQAGQTFTKNSSSPTVYSDRACYSCTLSCPPTTGINLFRNGGFEDSSTYYGPWYVTENFNAMEGGGSVIQPGRSSPNALVVYEGNEDSVLLTLNFVCSGHYYYYSLDWQERYDLTGIQIGFGQSPNQRSGLDVRANALNIWSTVKDYTFVRYDTTFRFSLSYEAEEYFDNLALLPITPTLKAKQGAVELLKNGGFESGSVAPWIVGLSDGAADYRPKLKGPSPIIVSPGLAASKYAFRILNKNGNSLRQNITAVPNRHYIAKLVYRSRQTDPFFLNATITLTGQRTRSIYNMQAAGLSQGSFIHPFVAREANLTVEYSFDPDLYCFAKNCSGLAFDIDNISIKETKPAF